MSNGGRKRKHDDAGDGPLDSQAKFEQLTAKFSTLTPDAADNDERLTVLKDRRDTLVQQLQYVKDNEGGLRGKFVIGTRGVELAIQRAIDALKVAIAEAETIAQRQRQFAARVGIKNVKGRRAGDGRCYVQFVNVGSGDCTIIATPLGRRIMIDCGSASTRDALPPNPAPDLKASDYIRQTIRNRYFLGSTTTIHLLLLTHPDKDHHNLISTVLGAFGAQLGFVYYGGTDKFNAYKHGTSLYAATSGGGAGQGSSASTAAVIRKVTLREKDTKEDDAIVVDKAINNTNVTTTKGQVREFADEWLDKEGKIVVYYEPNFTLSLLAGNVTGVWKNDVFETSETAIKKMGEDKSGSTSTNRRCLMVLVECFGSSILICGDATAVTERFALDYFAKRLAQVRILRVPHHGSPSSSLEAFVNATDPNIAVVSCSGMTTYKDHLPKQTILDLYKKKVLKGAGPHSIYGFKADDQKAHIYIDNTKRQLWATGSNGDYSTVIMRKRGNAP